MSTPLHHAVRKRDTEIVKLLIEHGADVNRKDDLGWTPLFWASASGNKEMFEILYTNLTNKNVRNCDLIFASYHGHTDVVSMLLSLKTLDVNHKNGNNKTALLAAIGNNKPETVKLLIEHGAKFDV